MPLLPLVFFSFLRPSLRRYFFSRFFADADTPAVAAYRLRFSSHAGCHALLRAFFTRRLLIDVDADATLITPYDVAAPRRPPLSLMLFHSRR